MEERQGAASLQLLAGDCPWHHTHAAQRGNHTATKCACSKHTRQQTCKAVPRLTALVNCPSSTHLCKSYDWGLSLPHHCTILHTSFYHSPWHALHPRAHLEARPPPRARRRQTKDRGQDARPVVPAHLAGGQHKPGRTQTCASEIAVLRYEKCVLLLTPPKQALTCE